MKRNLLLTNLDSVHTRKSALRRTKTLQRRFLQQHALYLLILKPFNSLHFTRESFSVYLTFQPQRRQPIHQ
jgi:hypothetical protein